MFYDSSATDGLQARQEDGQVQIRFAQVAITPEADGLLPDHICMNLFDDAQFNIQVIEQVVSDEGFMVWRGRTGTEELPEYSNVLILVNLKTGLMAGSLSFGQNHYFFEPVKKENYYRLTQYNNLMSESPVNLYSASEGKVLQARADPEDDEIYIIDLLVGFSEQKASQIADLELIATEMIEHVNTALINSRVDNVRLHLLGVSTTPNNPGVIPGTENFVEQWFADDIERLGPDFVAFVQALTGAEDEALGLAKVGGYVSDNGMGGSAAPVTVFRHEIGHNVGGGHCPGDDQLSGYPYAHGFSNGHWGGRTILCGNAINMYSNPDILDDQGMPLGDPATANMARVWRERAREMSEHRTRVLPPVFVNTTLDQLANDGLCSLREAVANISEGASVWGDCNTTGSEKISFSSGLRNMSLVLNSPLEIKTKLEMDCRPFDIDIQLASGKRVFSVSEEGFIKLHYCTISGNAESDTVGFDNWGYVGLFHSVVKGFDEGIRSNGNDGVVLMDSRVENNNVGVRSSGTTVSLTRSVVSNNRTAGIIAEGADASPLYVTESSINHNGQGIVVNTERGSHLLVDKSAITNNGGSLVKGGGIYLGPGSSGGFADTTISSNRASRGGGVYAAAGVDRLVMWYSTVAKNRANRGGGIYVSASPIEIRFNGTLLVDQLSSSNCWFANDVVPILSANNLVTDASCQLSLSDTLLQNSAYLAPLADNGGLTMTHALLSDSLAINGSTGCSGVHSDQRGFLRPKEICDIGAYQTRYTDAELSGGDTTNSTTTSVSLELNMDILNPFLIMLVILGVELSQ